MRYERALRNDSRVNMKFIQTRFQLIHTYAYNMLHVSEKKICLNLNGRCDEIRWNSVHGCKLLSWEAGDRIQDSQLRADASPKRVKDEESVMAVREGVGDGWLMDSLFLFLPLLNFRAVTLRIKGWVSVRTVRSSTWPESSPGTTSICTGNYIREGRKKIFQCPHIALSSCPSKAKDGGFENNESWRFHGYCERWTITSNVSITFSLVSANAYRNWTAIDRTGIFRGKSLPAVKVLCNTTLKNNQSSWTVMH